VSGAAGGGELGELEAASGTVIASV